MDNPQSPAGQTAPSDIPAVIPAPRPRSVSILLIGVLIITVLNLARFALSLRDWSFLASLTTVSPWYLALSGLVWAMAGAFLVWGLWRAKRWAPRLLQAIALTYALYYWLDLLILRDHPLRSTGLIHQLVLPTNWLFSAGVTIICLAYVAWTISRRKVKVYFGISEAELKHDQAAGNSEDDI